MPPFLTWWLKHSLIALVIFSIIYATGGSDMQAPWGTWTQTFLLLLTPLGALMGQLFVWAFKIIINIFFRK